MTATINEHRLPRAVAPRHYSLALQPDLESFCFTGRVDIDVDVVEPTRRVILNAAELAVQEVTVTVEGASLAVAFSLDELRERLVLELDADLPTGACHVSITFTGTLNDKLRGFYRSTFTDGDGARHTIATTQFESTNARRAFPCWDEPDRKATFDVELVIPEDLFAVSSGPETSRVPLGDGLERVTFGRTMVMSTYLLAFVVGPLEATPVVDVDGVALRIVHPRGKGHLTSFALAAGEFALRHFSDYFAIAYPDKKLDLVAIPDFAFGAMENQGCATFREILLLIDPDSSTQPEQQRAVDVIAHEIAHMWFGNLVTMGWWNGIWLKEAFATFCETHACAAYRPDWEPWTNFGLARSAAFDIDALLNTRPIEFEVVSPADAEAMYDVLTYEKGGAVVRMLEQYLGEPEFRAGIRHYLLTHSYANTETHDLWDAIEATSGEPVRRVMDGWIFKGGHPLVTVARVDATHVALRQEPFGFTNSDSDAQWDVPLVLGIHTGGDVRRQSVLLSSAETTVEVGSYDFVVANAEGSGFYRVRYEGALHEALVTNHAAMAAIERYGLVDDAWAAFVADRTPLSQVLDIIERLATNETDLAVWRRIAGVIDGVHHHLDAGAKRSFAQHAIAIANAALARIDSSAEVLPMGAQVRATLFKITGLLGDPDAVAAARALLDDREADPEMLAAAVNIVATNGGRADFERYVVAYESAPTPQDERRYLFALAEFPGVEETSALLAMIDDGRVRTQDAAFVLGHGLANGATGEQVWRHVVATWDQLNDRLPSNALPRMVSGITALAEETLAAQIRTFFGDHPLPQAGKTLQQYLERLDVNVGVRRRVRSQLG